MSSLKHLKSFLTLPTILVLSMACIFAGSSLLTIISNFTNWHLLDSSNGYGYGYGYGYTGDTYTYGYGYGYDESAIVETTPSGSSAGQGTLVRGDNGDTSNNDNASDTIDQDTVSNSLDDFLEGNANGSNEGNVEGSTFDNEINNAYQYAYAFGITTMGDVESALPEQGTTRAQLAKMMVQFANNALGKHMDASRIAKCNVYADVDSSLGDLKDFITAACASKIMGLEVDENTPLVNFDPNKIVSRGEIVTVLGRLILNHAYENMDPYYAGYMTALLNAAIITVNDPTLLDSRANIWIMLERAHKWLAGK